MILRNVFITSLFLYQLSSISAETKPTKYTVQYLETLKKDTRKDFENLQFVLSWTNGIPKIFHFGIVSMGIIQEELDAIPLFKNIAKVKPENFDAWVASQTNESVDALFKEADTQESLPKLIELQNAKLQNGKELTADGAFERLFQSTHFKAEHKKVKC